MPLKKIKMPFLYHPNILLHVGIILKRIQHMLFAPLDINERPFLNFIPKKNQVETGLVFTKNMAQVLMVNKGFQP